MKLRSLASLSLLAAQIPAVSEAAVAVQQQSEAENAEDPLIAADRRLAALALPLLVGNATLCRNLAPAAGIVLHSRDQYTANVERRFPDDALMAVAAIVPHSPADNAGIEEGAVVLSIADTDQNDWARRGFRPLRDGGYADLFDAPATFALTVKRDGMAEEVDIVAQMGCRALIEVTTEPGLAARADGRVIQISYGLMQRASNDQLTVILAHELAHQVMEHRRKLDAAGVRKGFFGQFGGDLRLNGLVEQEADRLSVHLIANAGRPASIAPAFWRSSLGEEIGGGLFRSRVYPSSAARAELLKQEIERYLRGGAPSYPGHLLQGRDQPFTR